MHAFTWVSGYLTEIHRFINVPMRWADQYPARERRELWLRTVHSQEVKLTVHTRALPARCGHRVVCVSYAGQLVGLWNMNTDTGINFIRNDPPLSWTQVNQSILVGSLIGAILAWCAGRPEASALALLAGALYCPFVMLFRGWQRSRLSIATDAAMESARQQAFQEIRLSRVK